MPLTVSTHFFLQKNDGWSSGVVWFKPELALSAADRLHVTGLFAVDWLPVMLISELVLSILMRRQVYNLRQLISNLTAPMFFHLVARLGMRACLVVPYTYVYENYRIVEYDNKHAWWLHLTALLFCDFCTYWVHRFMHECNLGWAGHIVHHSSMDYNISVGVRGGAFDIAHFGWICYLPLALICPPSMYLAHRTSNFVYSVFVHTELVGKLWWPIEFVMNTPSHHRVHHARNYGRKNFGDVLIIWDRMFGTFQEELEERKPLFGLNSQSVVQGTYNPLWHQVHHMVATIKLATSGKVPPVKALFTRITGPGMVHPKVTAALVIKKTKSKRVKAERVCADNVRPQFDSSYPWEKRAFTPLDFYSAFQLFLVVNPFLSYLKQLPDLSTTQVIWGSLFLAWSGTTVAWLCGATAVAMKHELFRLIVQGILAAYQLQTGSLLPASSQTASATLALSAVSFLFIYFNLASVPCATNKYK